LTELSVKENMLTLKGDIKSPGLARELVLTGFMRSLEEGTFEDVTLISTMDSSQDELSTFELRSGVE
jgi:hypothetical protein